MCDGYLHLHQYRRIGERILWIHRHHQRDLTVALRVRKLCTPLKQSLLSIDDNVLTPVVLVVAAAAVGVCQLFWRKTRVITRMSPLEEAAPKLADHRPPCRRHLGNRTSRLPKQDPR